MTADDRPPKQRTPPPPLDPAPLRALLASARMLWAAAGVEPAWRREERCEDALWTLGAIDRASGIRGENLGRHNLEVNVIDAAFSVVNAAEWLGATIDQGDQAEVIAARDRLASELALLAPALEVLETVRGLSEQTQETLERSPKLGISRAKMIEFLEHLSETIGPPHTLFARLEKSGRLEVSKDGYRSWRVRFTDPDTHRIFTEWHRLNASREQGGARRSKEEKI